MTRQIVYLITTYMDIPEFEGFATKDAALSLHSAPCPFQGRQWQARRFGDTWSPAAVIGRVRKSNDCPGVNGGLAFSQRAVDALRDILEPNGELLPLVSDVGQYYFYNVTTIADVLDAKKSVVNWGIEGELASSFDRYEFHSDKLLGLSIFQIPEYPDRPFVTEVFAERVRSAGLRGFNLQRVWPLPAGLPWWVLAKRQERLMARKGLPKGRQPKGNTVVIRLLFPDPTALAGPSEQQQIEAMMDALDGLLFDTESEAKLLGSLEGHDLGVRGECRLFISCPDADALLARLLPWLKSLSWNGGFSVMKRLGHYLDTVAKEENVKI